MYYSYVEIEYIATSFSPARTDLAVKLLRQITIDLCKSRLVTIETPRNHSLSQHQIIFASVEKYILSVSRDWGSLGPTGFFP
jgi:hypothetical protein